jgi:hypothetical protein
VWSLSEMYTLWVLSGRGPFWSDRNLQCSRMECYFLKYDRLLK